MKSFRTFFVGAVALTLGGSVAWAASTNFGQTWDYSMSASGIWEGAAVTWEKATNWRNDSTGENLSSGAKIPQYSANTLGSTLVDGNQFIVTPQISSGYKVATAPTLNGTNFKLGVANGVQLTIDKIGTAISSMNLFVDETSKLIIGSFDGQLSPSGTNNLHIDSENGLRVNGNLLSGTYQVYLGEKGSISIGGRINGATKTKFADVKLRVATTGTKRVSSRTIVSYGNKTGDFTFSNSSASEVDGLSLTKKDSVTVADAVGCYAFSQSSTAVTIQWVEGAEGGSSGDDPAPTPSGSMKVIAVNFNSFAQQINQAGGINSAGSDANQVSANDSGALDYAIPVAAWLQTNGKASEAAGEMASVYDIAAGKATGTATVRWTSANVWAYTGCTAKILNGYLDDSDAGAAVIVTDIPFKKYDVIFYAATDSKDNQFGAPEINEKRYTYVNGKMVEGDAAWGTSRSTTAAYGTNALRVNGLSGDLTIKGYGDSKAGYRGGIAALVIVERIESQDVEAQDLLLVNFHDGVEVDGWHNQTQEGGGTLSFDYDGISLSTTSDGNFYATESSLRAENDFKEGIYADINGEKHLTLMEEICTSLGLGSIAFNADVYKSGLMNAGKRNHLTTLSGLDPKAKYLIYIGFGRKKNDGTVSQSGFSISAVGYSTVKSMEYVVSVSGGNTTAATTYTKFESDTAIKPGYSGLMIVRLNELVPTSDGKVIFTLAGDRAGINFLAIKKLQTVEPEQTEFVFENTDCTAIDDGGTGNYKPVSMLIPASSDLPAGTKLRIKSVTFAAQVNSSYSTGTSAEFITINGVQSDSRTGLTSATDDWSIGKEMTFAFSEDAVVAVGEPATMGTVQGSGAAANLRIRLFKTTAPEYSYIMLDASTDLWRPVYRIVAEKYEPVSVSGKACLYDWTFTNTLKSVGKNGDSLKWDTNSGDGAKYANTRFFENELNYKYGVALNLQTTPYANFDVKYGSSWSAATIGVMPNVAKCIFVTFGTMANHLGLARGESENEVWVIGNGAKLDSFMVDDVEKVSHVYVMAFEGGTLRIFVDGVKKSEIATSIEIANKLQIGSAHGGAPDGFARADQDAVSNGASVQALRVYDHVLSDGEMTALKTEFYFEPTLPPRDPMTIYWKGGDGAIDGATVFEDGEGNDVKYMTGDTLVVTGAVKVTLARSVGPLRVGNGAVLQIAKDVGSTSKFFIDVGGTFDVNGVQDKTYPIVLNGGTLANCGAAIGDGKAQYWNLEVAADSFIDAQSEFGTIASRYGANALNLGGNTLIKRGAGNFYIANATFVGGGTIDVQDGTVVLRNGVTVPDDITVKLGPNGETIAAGTGFAINSGKIIFDISRFVDKQKEITLLAAEKQSLERFALADGTDENWEIRVDETSVKAVNVYTLLKLDGVAYPALEVAFANIKNDGAVLEIVDAERLAYAEGVLTLDGEAVDLTEYAVELGEGEGGAITVSRLMEGGALTIAEICPKPTAKDPNGVEAGWVELVNVGTGWVELSEYSFGRFNRGKKLDATKILPLPSCLVAPNGKVRFYTTEGYVEGDDLMFTEPKMTADATAEINGVLVYPAKVNPKKYPMVTLAKGGETICSVVIPCDTPDDASVVVEPADEAVLGGATRHYLKDGAKLTAIGPEVGPLYGIKHSFTDLNATPPAIPGEDYAITLDVNPVYGGGEKDEIAQVFLVYRTDLDEATRKEVEMTKGEVVSGHGQQWTAAIPFADFPEAGHLIQWKAKIVDAAGNTWYAPQFLGPDDGYEWYGTIVEPTKDQLSETLTTFHLFADAETADDKNAPNRNNQIMNIDYDEFMSNKNYDDLRTRHPYGARVAFYDSSTSNYYDNVRVDLRGNSSKDFNKKSHGLRFGKTHPLSTFDCVSGKTIEIRKSSFIAEFGDPSFLRQMTAFWLFNKHGSPAPFHYPARLNLNGEFYQLGFHSERFTDELIEDCYGLDPLGYGYKNIGTFGNDTSAGGIEKKTPDDGNESDLSVLNAFCNTLPTATVTSDADHAKYTKIVAEKMDIPAWINYIALTKITQECDDVWANLSGYYDNPQLIDGVRPGSTGTWRPLAYDMQLTFGQWHHADYPAFTGLMSNHDWFKSHPLYGGYAVRARKGAGGAEAGKANRAYEAIFQNEKFRRLFLRRVRTLMDEELGAPDTTGEETWRTSTINFMVQMRKMAALMTIEAEKDHAQWGYCNGARNINVWGNNYPKTIEEALADIWNNYVVPRRVHLYETHAAANTEKEIGYGENLIAGIPDKQTAIADLKDGFSYEAVEGGVVIRNANEETVDLSGWKLSGTVEMTLPAGTVIDQRIGDKDGEIFVVTDRRAYVAANKSSLTDEVIVGNSKAGGGRLGLKVGEVDIFDVNEKTDQEKYLRIWGFCGVPNGEGGTDVDEFIVLTNLCESAELNASGATVWIHKVGEPDNRCRVVLPKNAVVKAGGYIRLDQSEYRWEKITDGIVNVYLYDSLGDLVSAWEGTSKTEPGTAVQQEPLGVKGTGNFAIYDFANAQWSAMPIADAPKTELLPAIFDGEELLTPYGMKDGDGNLVVLGTAGTYGNGMTKEKVFDEDPNTYFDPPNSSDIEGASWAGIGFEKPVVITAIRFAVRSANAQRINGCSIQGANEPDFSDAENIHLIEVDSFYNGAEMAAELEDVHGPYKYVRIVGEYCGNIAELKLYGLVDSGRKVPLAAPIVTKYGLTADGRPTFTIVADEFVPQVYRVERTMVEGDGDEEAFLPLGLGNGEEYTWTDSKATPFAFYRVQGVNANGTSPWTTFTIAPEYLVGDAKPMFSVAPGEYNEAQALEITYSDSTAEIWYTTDGSDPVDYETDACHKYTGAITLSEKSDAPAKLGKFPTSAPEVKTRQGKSYGYYDPTADQPFVNIIRARAFKDGVKSSGEAFGTWLIGQNGTRHSGLRVVSLQTSPDNLFDDTIGIMVPGDIYKTKGPGSHSVGMPNANYFQSGRTWEREVNLELFEPEDRSKGFNQRVGVRVRGNWSRAAAKKSLTVYNRAEYGAKNLKYQLFNDEPDQKKFKRFLLRNGGNDWYEGNVRDAIAQGVLRGYLRTCSQGNEPSVLYINGEYWGIYNIRHGYAKQHFENWCGADGDNLDWIKLESSDSGRRYEVQEGDIVEFLKLRQYFRNHDFTTDEELAKAQEMIDFDDMIDYHIVHIFYGNADWISNNNNVGYWRERKPGAKWRFQLYDVDSVMGLSGGDGRSVDGIQQALGGSDDKIPPVFKKLSKNVKFQKMFVNRFADLLNTALRSDVTTNKLATLAAKMRPEVARNVARWENMTSVDAWESHISIINSFFLNRPAVQIAHLKNHFPDATGNQHKLSLTKTGEGEIQLNTIESGSGEGKFVLPFSGTYFENAPVTLTAKPAKGMMLEKWVVDGADYSTEPTVELTLTSDSSVEAVFVEAPPPVVPTRWEGTNVTERIALPPGDYEFANANFLGGIDLEEGDYKFKNDGGSSVNSIASLNGPLANVTFTGKGKMNITGEGDATLFAVQDLIVSNGVFAIDFTSTKEKTPAVTVSRNFLLDDKGTVSIALAGAQPRGIELTNKKMNATFAGGTFTATLDGTKASAFKFKGSDVVTLSGGKMDVSMVGEDAKVFNGGTITFKDGYACEITGEANAIDATAFVAGKTLTVDGGVFNINLPADGSEVFTTESDPTDPGSSVTINGGEITVVSGNDCVNAYTDIIINGGNFYGVSLKNDVIDANNNIVINGGNVLAYTTAVEDDGNGSAGLDTNVGYSIRVNGGNVIAIGGPNSSFYDCGSNVWTNDNLVASEWSGKFVKLTGAVNGDETHIWAKLPEFDVATISMLVFTPGMNPAVAPEATDETPPEEFATGFHDLYIQGAMPVVIPTRWENTNVTERIALPPGDYEFANVTFEDGLDLQAGDYKFKNDGSGSVNSIASLNGPLANVTFTGKGRMNITGEGDATLFVVQDLIVSNGVFAVDFTSTVEEVAAVTVAGNFLLADKGTVAITLDGAKPRGIELPNKKMNATFANGTFTATLGGTKASAFKFKGSDIVTLSGGTMDVSIVGTGAKVLNGGTIVFEDGYVCNIEGEETATDATVFESGKTLTVNGGVFDISVPGAGSQIFTTTDDPSEKDLTLTINGGTFTLLAGDDCVKSAGNDAVNDPESVNTKRNVVINGGNFYGVSLGNDVIDSNGDIIITGGNILAYTTATEEDGNGSTGLDVNVGRVIEVTGGNVIAIGGPNSSFHYEGGLAYTANDLAAADFSAKFIELDGKVGGALTRVWAKIPELDVDTISLFVFTPGIDPTAVPTVSDELPSEEYATGFHDLYICEHYSPAPGYRYYYYTATMPDEDFPAEWVNQLADMPSDVVLVLAGEGPNGFKYYQGSEVNTTYNNLHLVFESGMHSFVRINNGGGTQFANGATPENPTILVQDGATLTIQAKDFSGWNCTVDTTGIIRVNDGGVLNLVNDGTSTFFFSQQLYLDAGAMVNVTQKSSDRFRVNGGIDRNAPQIYMPASDGGTATITMEGGYPLNIGKDSHPNAAIFVGDGSTLVIDGNIQGLPVNETGRELKKYGTGKLKVTGDITNVVYTEVDKPTLCKVDGHPAGTFEDALQFLAAEGSTFEIVDTDRMSFVGGELIVDGEVVDLAAKSLTLTEKEGVFVLAPKPSTSSGTVLIISEIMPKPTDAQNRGTLEGMDPNGLESGWVELENTSDDWVDLADYKFIRVNRSKANSKGDYGNFPHRLVAPHSRVVFYTSERYANSADMSVSAFATPVDSEKPTILSDDLGGLLVWPDKVNPKKFAFVRLYYAPAEGEQKVVDTVVIPSDLPEGASIIVGKANENESTKRWISLSPTKGTANPSTEGLVALGPNVGPLYEIKDGKKHDSASEFALPVAPASPTNDYEIVFAANPVMNPDGALTPRNEDTFTKIEIVYRKDLDNTTLKTNEVDLATLSKDAKDWGNKYTTAIPQADLPEPGHLVQWKFLLTDKAGNTWTSPSFHNPDDGYEWYGTIVEPTAEQKSEKLTTWHMFVDAASIQQMDIDSDKQDRTIVPNNARVAIYDSSTSNYYDYVRIDLRGNTSAGFYKKSHGLRFAKAHPLTTYDCVSGQDVEEIRKSSLIAEWADPTFMRQMASFWLLNRNGSPAPFDFPVRCNLNGEFFQLAFHSERFTDELIEDVYGFDKFGYSYKEAATWNGSRGEKKTPDDENESDRSVLQKFTKLLPDKVVETDVDHAKYSKVAAENMDLAAWFNYMALTRITQETDDIWANIGAYLDDPAMIEGHRGTGTWRPLAYDMNLSFGQWYKQVTHTGLMADEDWFKCHPFYGGHAIRAYKNDTMQVFEGNPNNAYEAIYQSEKFRRLYLRRLRTLMDKELGAPNAEETLEDSTIPFIVFMREMKDMIAADAELDRQKWGYGSGTIISVWKEFPTTVEAGLEDLWTSYVVPRREHLYVTHSIDAENVGYGSTFAAGIPHAQSPIADLREGITAEYDAKLGAVVIRNANEETIDLSDWELSGPVSMTIPAGTVIDQAMNGVPGEVYVTADRRTTVAAMTITDQIIVGNGKAGKADAKITLTAADGTKVIFEPSPAYNFLRLHSFDGITPTADGDTDEWITLTNLSNEVQLDLAGVKVVFLKDGDALADAKCVVTFGSGVSLAAGDSLTLKQGDFGWKKITNGKLNFYLTDADGMSVQSLYINQKDGAFANYYGEGGPGGAFHLQATTFAQESETFVEVAYPVTEIEVDPAKEPVNVEATSAEEATNKVVLVVTVPEEAKGAVSEEAYKGYFMLKAEEKLDSEGQPTGKWTVEAVLNPDVVQPEIEETETIDEPFTMKDEGGEVTVKTLPGLRYELIRGTEVGAIEDVRASALATGDKITLADSLKTGETKPPAAFYRVRVTK